MTQEQIKLTIVSAATTIDDENGTTNYFVLTQAALKDLVKSLHQQSHDHSCYAYSVGLNDGKDCGRLDNRW